MTHYRDATTLDVGRRRVLEFVIVPGTIARAGERASL